MAIKRKETSMKIGMKVRIKDGVPKGMTGVIAPDDLNMGMYTSSVVRLDNPRQEWVDQLPDEAPEKIAEGLYIFYPSSTKTEVKIICPNYVLEVIR
jgi:hypothetical protein